MTLRAFLDETWRALLVFLSQKVAKIFTDVFTWSSKYWTLLYVTSQEAEESHLISENILNCYILIFINNRILHTRLFIIALHCKPHFSCNHHLCYFIDATLIQSQTTQGHHLTFRRGSLSLIAVKKRQITLCYLYHFRLWHLHILHTDSLAVCCFYNWTKCEMNEAAETVA